MSGAMSVDRRSSSSWPRRAFMASAFLALFLQLLFPAGFMAAEPGQAHGLPIVICSAQGQTVVDWNAVSAPEHGKKAPAKSMANCPFAGHAVASDPPPPAALAMPVAFDAPGASGARSYLVFPGRGLAAPPPPAIGPPLQA